MQVQVHTQVVYNFVRKVHIQEPYKFRTHKTRERPDICPISANVQVAIFYGCSRVQEKGSRYFFNGSSRSKSRHRNSIKIQGRRCRMITRTRGHLVTYDHPIYESNSLDQTILSSVKQLRLETNSELQITGDEEYVRNKTRNILTAKMNSQLDTKIGDSHWSLSYMCFLSC